MPRVSIPSGQSPSGQSIGGPGRAAGSLNTQTWLRIQRVARMEISGVSDRTICAAEGFDHPALAYLRKLIEYQEVKNDLLQGHLTEMDRAIAGKVDVLRGEIRNAVPSALRCLIDAVNQRRDLRTAIAASVELLDRDPDKLFLKAKDLGAVPAGLDGSSLPTSLQEEITRSADAVTNEIKKEKVM